MTYEEIKKANIEISEIIEAVKNEMCDHYCKYPIQYQSDIDDVAFAMMIEDQCSECPLDFLGG